MRASKCISGTATALHRVFVAPNGLARCSSAILPHPINSSHLLLPAQRRAFVNLKQAEKSRLPRDDEIKSWSVTLIDEDGNLQGSRSTMAVLDGMDRKKDSLVVVKPGEPGVPPVCKIMNKLAMRESEKARRKAERKGGSTSKNIELNWAIDRNDLGHRLNKMKEFLAKGQKVEVLLAGKKKGRKATEEEAKAVIKKIKATMEEVPGARETKAMEGTILGTATFFMEGKVQKGTEAATANPPLDDAVAITSEGSAAAESASVAAAAA